MLASVHEVDVHEVDSALARAQTKVDEVYGPYGSSPSLPSLRRQSSRKPYNIFENHTNSKKITYLYHLPPDGYNLHRILPDFTGLYPVTPNTTK